MRRHGIPEGVVGGINEVHVSFSGMTEDGARGNALSYLRWLFGEEEFDIIREKTYPTGMETWESEMDAEFHVSEEE